MYCRPGIWDKCNAATGFRPIVWLKGEKEKIWEFETFYRGMSGFPVIFFTDRKHGTNNSYRLATGLLSRHGDALGQEWVNRKFDGDWIKAIRAYENFEELFGAFEQYFAERRSQFMEKTADIIKTLRPDVAKIKQIKTNSHGGVANLLKVLTRTMHEQGSTIQSIAKMQYCVCTQAGIYLPDEFITDVLTAMDMSEEIAKDAGKHQE